MNLEKARKIWWNYGMSDTELEEWVWMVNNRPPDPPNVHVGETVPLTGFEPVALALLAPRSNQLSYKGVLPPLGYDPNTSR